MTTRELPKLIFRDDDLPTITYRRCQTSETDMAVRDVGRSLQPDLHDERVEILGWVSPEAGMAAEIEDLCTLSMVAPLEVPGRAERSITPEDLPAIPISEVSQRRASRRRSVRTAGVAAWVLAVALVVGGEEGVEQAAFEAHTLGQGRLQGDIDHFLVHHYRQRAL